MKKRYLIFGLIALELAAFPAAAQILDKVVFSVRQKAIHVVVSDKPGVKKYAVTSNAPFAVTSESAIGEFDIVIHKSGQINGQRFGDNAQLPGAAQGCAMATSPLPTAIYRAHQKTAAQPGKILSQAVIIEIHYDPETAPNIKIMTQEASKHIALGQACEVVPA